MSDWRMRLAGDAAVTVAFEPRIDPVINARVVALAAGVRARHLVEVEDIVRTVVDEAREGDLVVVMSNGAFGGIHGRLLEALAASGSGVPQPI